MNFSTALAALVFTFATFHSASAAPAWTYNLKPGGNSCSDGNFASCHSDPVFQPGAPGRGGGANPKKCAYLNLGTQGLPDEGRNGMAAAPQGGPIKKGDGSTWGASSGKPEKYVIPGAQLENATVERCQKALQQGYGCCELDNMDGCENPGQSKIPSCANIVELYKKICALSVAQGGSCVVKNSPKILKQLLSSGARVDYVIAEFGVDQPQALKEILGSGIPANKVHAIFYTKGKGDSSAACSQAAGLGGMIVNSNKDETVDPAFQKPCGGQ